MSVLKDGISAYQNTRQQAITHFIQMNLQQEEEELSEFSAKIS